MHQIKITISGRVYQAHLPENWEEIPTGKWEELGQTMKSEELFSRDLLALLMQDHRGRKLPNKVIKAIPAGHLGHFFDCLGWLITEPMTTPHLSYIKLKGKKYYLPAEKFSNMTVIEFAFIDMAWQLRAYFIKTKQAGLEKEWTARLFSDMLRPAAKHQFIPFKAKTKDAASYEGDIRERFNSSLSEERWPLFLTLSASDQMWMLRYVAGCKRHLADRYKIIWPSSEEDYKEVLARAASAKTKPQPTRWIDTIRKMSGGKFGDFDSTCYTGLYTILDELSDQLKATKKREREAVARRIKQRR